MKKGHKLILAGALGMAAIGGGILTAGVSAYRGDFSKVGPNYSAERHEDMMKAFENNDYNAWKNLHQGKGRASEVITEENFSKFSEMRKLMLEGKTDEANKIREQLGLGQRYGNRGMDGNSMRGRNMGGNFVDNDKDGHCDNLQK